ncbi:MAG: metal ABC transporter substrate-binding protein, partial [Actinomycetes bacterium]
MSRRGTLAAAAAASLLLVTGCAATEGSADVAGTEDRVSVVTAFYPFQFVAERVAGPHAQVSSLTTPGSEPHDLELTPRQVASLAEADLVVYERSFQPAVDEAVAQSGTERALDTTTVVPLQPRGTAEVDEEHADEDKAHDEEAHGDEAPGDEAHGDEAHAEEAHDEEGL